MLGLAMLSPSSHNQFSSRHGTAVGTVNNYTYNCKYANNNITTAEPRGYHEISRLRKYGKTDHAPRQVYTESNRV